MPFQYKPRSRESYEARANFRGGASSYDRMFDRDIVMFKPKKGENRIRILPPTWDDAKHYGLDLYVNYGVGPDRGSYLSLSAHKIGPDPIDEARMKAIREQNDKLEKDLRWTRRIAIWLIDRAEPEKGPMLWLSPATSFDQDVIQQSKDRETGEILRVDDPNEGYDIYFNKDGEKINTKYSGVSVARRPSPLHQDPAVMEGWLDYVQANPIPSMLKFYPYERIAAVMKGESLSGGMEEVAPSPQSQTAQPQPQVTQTPPPAPAAPPAPWEDAPASQTPPHAPAVVPTAPAEANLDVQNAQNHAQQNPQSPAPDLTPLPTRTRPTNNQQEFGDVPY